MTEYIKNPLTFVWMFLTLITVASWSLGGGGVGFQLNPGVTVSVLVIAAIKTYLVIRYFMEVRFAPPWLKGVTDGWLVALFLALVIAYCMDL